MKVKSDFLKLAGSIVFAVSVLSCGLGGGGGGGGDELSAADASINADPREIDSGDRIRVNVFLSDIKEDGVLLKVRYSNRLQYVRNSTTLRVNDEEVKVNPATEQSVNFERPLEDTYLVYDLPHDAFGDENDAEVELVVEGKGKLTNGLIEVDADFNDPTLGINQKFSILSPEFNSKDSVQINVNDESGQVRPTITFTPSITPTASVTPSPTSTRTPRPSNTPTPTP